MKFELKAFLEKNKKILFPTAFVAVLAGIVLIWFGLMRPFTVLVNGETYDVKTPALTVSGVLRAAGVPSGEFDRVQPVKGRLIWNQPVITVESARDVVVKTPKYELNFQSADKIPANILKTAEIPIYPNDQVRVNGALVDADGKTTPSGSFVLQYTPAQPITLEMEGQTRIIYSAEPTIGIALESAGIEIGPQDAISLDSNTPLIGPLTVEIRRAKTVIVAVDETTVTGLTAATTVGWALQDLNIPLQNLDYSVPAEDAALPEDGKVQVVRVREEILVMTDEIPYTNETVEDPNTPLDQTSVIVPGQVGIYATRERVRYDDNVEVQRDVEPTWQASEAKNGVVGIGTQVVTLTTEVNGETLEYYRTLYVWTTSYKPCDTAGNCYYYTSSGLPVDRGVIAVSYDWYLLLSGQRIYVPGYGYGVVADVCGGCVGKPWIDLGYPEDGYDPMPNHWTTIYLLTPAPDYVPLIMP
jgi:resuscitation-promoting factor RpfB